MPEVSITHVAKRRPAARSLSLRKPPANQPKDNRTLGAAHTVTVKGPSGKERTFKVDPQVDLSTLKAGDDIVLRATDALAIDVTASTGQ